MDAHVVLDRRERLVEVVQEFAPPLVLRRAAKPLSVVLEAIPLDYQEVNVGAFDGAWVALPLSGWRVVCVATRRERQLLRRV
jgi:hypothetical protein